MIIQKDYLMQGCEEGDRGQVIKKFYFKNGISQT